jgi:superfamily II DNA/RNA helicase
MTRNYSSVKYQQHFYNQVLKVELSNYTMAPAERREVTRAWDQMNPPLSGWVLDAISSMGFEKATPVQSNAVPLFLGNKDVVVR